MANYIQLKQTPIREIILTISFKESLEIGQLDAFRSLPAIVERFPHVGQGFNTQVQAIENTPPTTKVLVDGFVLRNNNPHTKLLQARRGSLAFHKVNGYEKFDVLIDEFKTYWNLLINSCGSLTVNRLTVRYLNFIDVSNGESINEMLRINLIHPFGDEVKNMFTQQRFTDKQDSSININVVSATAKYNNETGIILDIILNKKVETDLSTDFNFAYFFTMRQVKNEIFFRCITEKTIKKYNQ